MSTSVSGEKMPENVQPATGAEGDTQVKDTLHDMASQVASNVATNQKGIIIVPTRDEKQWARWKNS
jgi:hypothetical protein